MDLMLHLYGAYLAPHINATEVDANKHPDKTKQGSNDRWTVKLNSA